MDLKTKIRMEKEEKSRAGERRWKRDQARLGQIERDRMAMKRYKQMGMK